MHDVDLAAIHISEQYFGPQNPKIEVTTGQETFNKKNMSGESEKPGDFLMEPVNEAADVVAGSSASLAADGKVTKSPAPGDMGDSSNADEDLKFYLSGLFNIETSPAFRQLEQLKNKRDIAPEK